MSIDNAYVGAVNISKKYDYNNKNNYNLINYPRLLPFGLK